MRKLDPEFKAKWTTALRSGEYKQGREGLIFGEGENAQYCCLGVGYCIATGKNPADTTSGYIEKDSMDIECVPEILVGNGHNPTVRALVMMNDGSLNCKKKSFPEIADWIDANL